MSRMRRLAIPFLVLVAAACTPRPTSQAPRPLKPEDGPRATIRVGYTGGLINRTLRAQFRTDEHAYVLVAHLGGDGVIRVLYPDTPDESGLVRGGKTYQTATTGAEFDGIPSLFSLTMSPYRSGGALYDSYDGRGHGYVFLVASGGPLNYGRLEDGISWSDWVVSDYTRSSDPRRAIRDFADMVAGGRRYTLKFASSFMTDHYDSYAARSWDCAVLSHLGLFNYGQWWGSWNSALWGLRSSPTNYCSRLPAYAWYAGMHRPAGSVIHVPPGTPGAAAPTLDRPGRRAFGPRDERPTRSALTRVGGSARANPFGDHDRANRRASPRPTYGESGRGTIARERGRHSDDRGFGRRSEGSDRSDTRRGSETSGTSRSGGTSSSAGSSAGASRGGGEARSSSPRDVRPNGGRPDQS